MSDTITSSTASSTANQSPIEGATRTARTTSRCGTPDPEVGAAFVTICAWPTASLTYAFDIGTTDVEDALEFDAVRTAFGTWSAVAPVTFTEVGGGTQHPDVMIGWRPAEDPDVSMVGNVHAHAAYPPTCSGPDLPKPIHFDKTETTWAIGAVRGAIDIETVALHEIGHILGLGHSSVAGTVMASGTAFNSTERVLRDDDIAGVRQLYPPHRLAAGTYTVRQLSSGRFLDAHETSVDDHRAVTVPGAVDDSQRWDLTPIGTVCSLRHKSSGRFLDAHEIADFDFRLVTRPMQGNATQRWVLLSSTGGSTTIQQLSNGRSRRRPRHGSEGLRRRHPPSRERRQPALAPGAGGTEPGHDPPPPDRPVARRPRDRGSGLLGGHPAGPGQRLATVDPGRTCGGLPGPPAQQRPVPRRPRDPGSGLLGGDPPVARPTTPSSGSWSRWLRERSPSASSAPAGSSTRSAPRPTSSESSPAQLRTTAASSGCSTPSSPDAQPGSHQNSPIPTTGTTHTHSPIGASCKRVAEHPRTPDECGVMTCRRL